MSRDRIERTLLVLVIGGSVACFWLLGWAIGLAFFVGSLIGIVWTERAWRARTTTESTDD